MLITQIEVQSERYNCLARMQSLFLIICQQHVILVNIIQTKADVIPYLSPLLRATSSDPIDKSPTPWIRPQPYIPHNLAFDSIIN